MEINNIKQLIEAFYNGETSIEEEKALFDYFANDEVPHELISEKKYFDQLRKLDSIEIPKELPIKIDSLFDSFEKQETKTRRIKRILLWTSSVAAIIILLLTGYHYNMDRGLMDMNDSLLAKNSTKIDSQATDRPVFINYPDLNITDNNIMYPYNTNDWDEFGTEDDYQKMEKALKMVSESLEEGLNQLSLITDDMPTSSELLNNM